jgi:UDP-glucose 4-epimerase
MTAKRILITGPLGHIGSKIIHNIKPGDFEEVILIDNLSTQRYCSLFNLPKGVSFHFIEADILEADLDALCKNVDVVLHLAAITDAANSFGVAEQVERMNYGGTEKLAKACAANNCRLIFLSTTSVYGTQEKSVDENCSAEELQPQSP